jgi:hypothetical protein
VPPRLDAEFPLPIQVIAPPMCRPYPQEVEASIFCTELNEFHPPVVVVGQRNRSALQLPNRGVPSWICTAGTLTCHRWPGQRASVRLPSDKTDAPSEQGVTQTALVDTHERALSCGSARARMVRGDPLCPRRGEEGAHSFVS